MKLKIINNILREKDQDNLFLRESINLINESGLFDEKYYIENNKDIIGCGMSPIVHFILYGGSEGRDPSKLFSSKHYLANNHSIREQKSNPLIDYILKGKISKSRTKKRRNQIEQIKSVDIINVNFFDWDGGVLYKGGAERYVFDLARNIIQIGMKPRIIQNANRSFRKMYRGVEVIGIKTGAKGIDGNSIRTMSKKFAKFCSETDLIVASPLDLACEMRSSLVIGVNHGIHWDTNKKHLYNNRTSDYQEIFDAIDSCSLGVAVDTNFINWLRTYDYDYASKFKYIPNYYDKNDFKFIKKDIKNRIRFMYPRRLYEARGINITLEAFEVILSKYPLIDLMLVGQTNDKNIKSSVSKLINKFPDRVTIQEFNMEDMHKAYEKSHVVLIPTLYAEGTSLSCIEAMATNNAIIATNIGGLPNLVVDGFNGYLIEPNTDALIESVSKIAENTRMIEKFAANGIKMVECFEKNNWDNKWKKILDEEIL